MHLPLLGASLKILAFGKSACSISNRSWTATSTSSSDGQLRCISNCYPLVSQNQCHHLCCIQIHLWRVTPDRYDHQRYPFNHFQTLCTIFWHATLLLCHYHTPLQIGGEFWTGKYVLPIYRVIRNDCRGFNNLPPHSPDATPCDFFLRDYEKGQVYVRPLPASIPELNVRIRTAIETITADMLQTVWNELDYRVDVCRITKGAHIEHL